MLELSFYWSMTLMQIIDREKKNFWEMFIHHIVSISFLNFFWIIHLHRFGVIGLVLNDCSHPLLPLAKLFRFTNHMKVCDAVFITFIFVWILSRLYSLLFSFAGIVVIRGFFLQILIANLITSTIPSFPAYDISFMLLAVLQLLNIIWTFFIFKVILFFCPSH